MTDHSLVDPPSGAFSPRQQVPLTRRALLAQGGRVALAVLAASCSGPASPAPQPSSGTPPTAAPTAAPTTASTPTAQPTPPLEAMLGQMVMVGFRGLGAPPGSPIAADVHERSVGSVVLFDYDVTQASPIRNVESPGQVRALTGQLQALAPTPLLIAVDEEGGSVARLSPRHGFPATVSAQALGERNDLAYTSQQATALAATLAAAGINHNLAPVVDLNVNPDSPAIGRMERSFSADPVVVIAQAQAFIEAHHAQHITTTLKHFPGHGSATADSHLGIVDVTATWQPVELESYRALIKQGLADAVMTAHVFNAKLDPTYPATLSKSILSGILRQELGFDGVIISDDMNMGAITSRYGFADALVLAVNAGVDILAYGNNLTYDEQIAAKALAALSEAVAAGKITKERVAEAYRRVAALKAKHSRAPA